MRTFIIFAPSAICTNSCPPIQNANSAIHLGNRGTVTDAPLTYQLPYFVRHQTTPRCTSHISQVFRSNKFRHTSPLLIYRLPVLLALPLVLILSPEVHGCTWHKNVAARICCASSVKNFMYNKRGAFDHSVARVRSSFARALFAPVDSRTWTTFRLSDIDSQQCTTRAYIPSKILWPRNIQFPSLYGCASCQLLFIYAIQHLKRLSLSRAYLT